MAERKPGIIVGEDGVARCFWVGNDPLYCHYHDTEWGFPERNDQRLFEKVCLEGFQAGLSWITILRKRENFRKAFRDFEIETVARMNQRSVTRLLSDAGIVRHRAKIESAINNARRARELESEVGSLARFFWDYEPEAKTRPKRLTRAAVVAMTTSPESVAMARALKSRGWTFIGPTTSYAFMQAMGLVNDHLDGCAVRAKAEAARTRFRRPSRGGR